ncbi:MAG: hypothetical protein JRG79_20140, partial [Deltaproteobacteria bacterium]|nr:hypothetical protein [Deltaproteobacteria bacterium]
MELLRIWAVVVRRKWTVIQAVVLITLVAGLGSYLVTPTYQASSKILIKQSKKGTIGDLAGFGIPGLSSAFSTSANTDVSEVLASSRPYLEEVISKLQLSDDEGDLLRPDGLTSSGIVDGLKRRLWPRPRIAVNQYRDTDILQIKASSQDPSEAMMMANTLAEIMVDRNQTQMRAEYRSATTF